MKKYVLQSHANRNKAVKTRWGTITFDAHGFSEIELSDEDLPLMRSLRWLVEPTQPDEDETEDAEPDEKEPVEEKAIGYFDGRKQHPPRGKKATKHPSQRS